MIGHSHVLTAGHCLVDDDFQKVDPRTIKVYFGINSLVKGTVLPEPYFAKETFVPSEYVFFSEAGFDIGVITLAKPVTLSRSIYPICLPDDESRPYSDRKVKVLGYGSVNAEGDESLYPLEADMDIIKCR